MKKIQVLATFVALFFATSFVNAQLCTLSVTPNNPTITCGASVDLNALGLSPTPALSTSFNDSTIGLGWATSAVMLYNNPCGPSLDGTPAAWFGDVPLPRTLTTNGFDVSCGGQVCFDLDFAGDDACGGCSDCEDPDLANEGVFFQYSIDNGATWVDIFYFEAVSNYANAYYQWDNYCFDIPPAAWTTNTMFQWDQPAISSSVNDHWGIDNVVITPSNCGYVYDWDNVVGTNDPPQQTVAPLTTTTYAVQYYDTVGVDICYDTVVVTVLPLTASATSSLDSLICGDCADLNVVFTNDNAGSIVDDFDPTEDGINWSSLSGGTAGTGCGGMTGNGMHFDGTSPRNITTVPIDATVCATVDFCMFMGNTGSGGAPCENADAGEDVILEYSTDGGGSWTTIQTYLQSVWDGNNAWQCFSEAIPGPAQTTATLFRWNQPSFSSCTGCDNWAIDDVNIACTPPVYTYSWTPALGLDDAAIQSPQACLGGDTTFTATYEATIVNTVTGCSASDSVSLVVQECSCFFMSFDATTQCGSAVGTFDVVGDYMHAYSPTTGTIEVEAINGTGSYSTSINGPFTDSTLHNFTISGIPNDGSPTSVVIYFSDSLSCFDSIVVTPPVLPTVSGIGGGAEYCEGDPTLPITVDVTGTGPWTIDYTIDGTPYSANGASSPITLESIGGIYVINVVTDSICSNSSTLTDTITVHPLPAIDAGADVDLCDGDQHTLNGSGGINYVWDNGGVNGIPFTPAATTTYTVMGTDANGCVNTDQVTVNVTQYPPAPGVGPQGGEYCTSDFIPPFDAVGTGQQFTWYVDSTLTTPLGNGVSWQPGVVEGTTTYYVTQSVNGCEGPAASVSIFMESCEAIVVIPNVITPDGDNVNDVFHPIELINVTELQTTILNRWGNLIYETNDVNINWNGVDMSGNQVSEGTYFYMITYKDVAGDQHEIHGRVQVIFK